MTPRTSSSYAEKYPHRLLERSAEKDLGAGPHAQDLVGYVDALGDEVLGVID